MIEVCPGWILPLDRGPDWLFVKLTPPPTEIALQDQFAESVWQAMECHFVYRVILEMDGLPTLPSYLIGQLVLLQKRVCTHGGLLRLVGLSDANERVLHMSRLGDRFPTFGNRSDAVMGYRPNKPR